MQKHKLARHTVEGKSVSRKIKATSCLEYALAQLTKARSPSSYNARSSRTVARSAANSSCARASCSGSVPAWPSDSMYGYEPSSTCLICKNSTYPSSRPACSITIARPERPARAVRPQRWWNTLGSLGGSYCTTTSTSGRSKPRAATSVHSSTFMRASATPASSLSPCWRFACANAANVAVRRFGVCLPCSEKKRRPCNASGFWRA